MTRRVVIFCSDVYGALGLIRSLGEDGYKPECYCYGKDCRYLLASRYVSQGCVFNTAEEAIEYLLHDYPVHDDKPVLFTIPDLPAYLVDLHLDQLREKFILMTAGEQGKIGYWMDKRNVVTIARNNGLTIPRTIELSKEADIPGTIHYPVFTKSIRTVDGGKQDESICRNPEELKARKATMASDPFFVMDYIRKKQEICYYGMAIKGKVYIDFYDIIDRFPKDSFGYYGTFYRCEDDAIRQKCVSMMEEIGYEGLFDIEFLLGDDGVLYFMEVNFRVDGALYKLTPGVNLPAEWCRLVDVAKEDLPDSLLINKDHFTGITEFQDFKACVLTGLVSPFKWLREFFTADRRMIINIKDPKPLFAWVGDAVRKRIKTCLCPG